MEDIVGVRLELIDGENRCFVTGGRIQHRTDPEPLERLILRHASSFSITAEAKSAKLCDSLQACSAETYFFEALFALSQEKIPFGSGYEAWRMEKAARMAKGKEIYFLGNPSSAADER